MRTGLILLILTALTLIPVWIALFLWLRETRGNHKLRIGIFKGLLGRAEKYQRSHGASIIPFIRLPQLS
jgi:hypothetical protein